MNEIPRVDFTFFLLNLSFNKFNGEDLSCFFTDFDFEVDFVDFALFPFVDFAVNSFSAIRLCVSNEDTKF